MKRGLILVELTEEGDTRTVLRTAGFSMERIGELQAGITAAAIDLLLKEKGFPESHRPALEEVVTKHYFTTLRCKPAR